MKVYLTILFFAAGVFISSAQTNVAVTVEEHMLALPPTNSPPAPAATNTPAATATTNAPAVLSATNTPPVSSATNAPAKPAREKIIIHSDGLNQLDLLHRVATYQYQVSVTGDQWKMTCEWLMANLPPNGEHITNIVAQTNVVGDFFDEKNQRWHVTGDKGVYAYHVEDGVTNEKVTLYGHPPRIEEGPDTNTITGDMIIYDMVAKKVMIPSKATGTFFAGTNSPAGTNSSGPGINPF